MDASALLDRLDDLGVTVTVDGDDVLITPGDKVPTDLIPLLKERKPELLTHLRWREDYKCRACLCDTWNAQARTRCETCQGRLCARCNGCLTASLVWRRAQIDALYADVPVNELLERLRKGSQWLRDQDLLYFDGDREQAANDELFSQMWALWSDLAGC